MNQMGVGGELFQGEATGASSFTELTEGHSGGVWKAGGRPRPVARHPNPIWMDVHPQGGLDAAGDLHVTWRRRREGFGVRLSCHPGVDKVPVAGILFFFFF